MSPVLLKLPSGDKQATEDCGRCSHDKGGRLGGSDFPGQHPPQTSRLLVLDTRVLTGQESRHRSDTCPDSRVRSCGHEPPPEGLHTALRIVANVCSIRWPLNVLFGLFAPPYGMLRALSSHVRGLLKYSHRSEMTGLMGH